MDNDWPLKPPDDAEIARSLGQAFNGSVSIRDYDFGVCRTMGAIYSKVQPSETDRPDALADPIEGYFLPISGIEYPPGCPGVPIVFSYPEDRFGKYRKSSIMVRRDDISPAMERWHPGATQAQFAAPGALPGVLNGYSGYNRSVVVTQATPYDITYTIQITAPYRSDANRILDYVLRVYGPYSYVVVPDSVGDKRLYSAFMEGTSIIDDSEDVANRTIGFTVTLRIQAELDQLDPYEYLTVTQPLDITMVPPTVTPGS
jgi:hypothetical protein